MEDKSMGPGIAQVFCLLQPIILSLAMKELAWMRMRIQNSTPIPTVRRGKTKEKHGMRKQTEGGKALGHPERRQTVPWALGDSSRFPESLIQIAGMDLQKFSGHTTESPQSCSVSEDLCIALLIEHQHAIGSLAPHI